MTDSTGNKSAAAAVFDEHADAYVDSAVHREGDDLATLAAWCTPASRVLDVATGAGHTGGAVTATRADDSGGGGGGARTVVATDAAPGMVQTAVEEYPALRGVVADAERLPFDAASFDGVTCRIAAHHFPDPTAFVDEVARVTEPGGIFAFEDNVAPEDETLDAYLNRLETLRDPTHYRSHRVSEWTDWVTDAGFTIEDSTVVKSTIDYQDWVDQLDTPATNRQDLESLFADPPTGATEEFEITREGGETVTFANLKLLLKARRSR